MKFHIASQVYPMSFIAPALLMERAHQYFLYFHEVIPHNRQAAIAQTMAICAFMCILCCCFLKDAPLSNNFYKGTQQLRPGYPNPDTFKAEISVKISYIFTKETIYPK